MNKDKCKNCKYVLMDTHVDGMEPYRCVNQDSPHFGQAVGAGCDGFDRFNPRPDMPFKDALQMLIMLPEGSYSDYWFKFGKPDEISRPFYSISFKDNKQMFEWRDAMMRCFDELMRLKQEAGDFTEEEQHED